LLRAVSTKVVDHYNRKNCLISLSNCKNYALFGWLKMQQVEDLSGTTFQSDEFDKIHDGQFELSGLDKKVFNIDTRRKIENLLEEKALKKLLEDDFNYI
jgi:hypothetical protein